MRGGIVLHIYGLRIDLTQGLNVRQNIKVIFCEIDLASFLLSKHRQLLFAPKYDLYI
jgi:hypothetical protein